MTAGGNAKLNLYLDITGTLENNYHSIESVMQSVDLADDITVHTESSDESEVLIICDNPAVPADERNIAYKAAKAFFERLNADERYKTVIDIKKNIPVEAGLGGSSTDGAAVLLSLNELFGKPLPIDVLCRIGAALGADVPFCITRGTAACKGKGEVITKLRPIIGCVFLIIKPDFSLGTQNGYKLYDMYKNRINKNPNFNRIIEAVESGRFYENSDLMHNVFEQVYCDSRIDAVKSDLMKNGAAGSLLTGSGSAVFGVFDGMDSAERAMARLEKKYKQIFLTRPV